MIRSPSLVSAVKTSGDALDSFSLAGIYFLGGSKTFYIDHSKMVLKNLASLATIRL